MCRLSQQLLSNLLDVFLLMHCIEAKIKAETQFTTIELTTHTNEDLIGGFVLSFDNNLVDASIKRDLLDIKKQFLSNEFVAKL